MKIFLLFACASLAFISTTLAIIALVAALPGRFGLTPSMLLGLVLAIIPAGIVTHKTVVLLRRRSVRLLWTSMIALLAWAVAQAAIAAAAIALTRPSVVDLLESAESLSDAAIGPFAPLEDWVHRQIVARKHAPTKPKHLIRFRITSAMWNANKNRAEPTPKAVIKKIQKAFELWASATDADLAFEYDGMAGRSYDDAGQIPEDGELYVVLNGEQPFGNLEAGKGGFVGSLPDQYKKGFVFLNLKAGLYPLRFETLLHEIGHAIGISRHSASIESIMSCGSKAWGDEFLAFSEQDRLDLAQVWNPSKNYSISGQVESSEALKFADIFAVDIVTGRTYSASSDSEGRFVIPIGHAGRYRVMVKALEGAAFERPVAQCPSWYVRPGESTNDPKGGSVLALSDADRRIEGISIRLLDQPVAFNFYWSRTYGTRDGSDFVPSFLRRGRPVRFNLIYNGGDILSVEPYGERPDIELKDLEKVESNGTFMVTVTALPSAAQGHRLIVAKGRTGPIQAGLVGIHVIGRRLPSRIGSSDEEQLAKDEGYSELDPYYWYR